MKGTSLIIGFLFAACYAFAQQTATPPANVRQATPVLKIDPNAKGTVNVTNTTTNQVTATTTTTSPNVTGKKSGCEEKSHKSCSGSKAACNSKKEKE